MPGRLTIAFILIFFVGMLGWQWLRNHGTAYGDGPQLKPSLELAAEDGTTKWKMLLNQKRLGDAQTTVTKSSTGVFILKQVVILDGDLESFMGPLGLVARTFSLKLNDYRAFINTEMELSYLGTMQKLNLSFTINPRPVLTREDVEKERAQAVQTTRKGEKEDSPSLMKLIITADTKQIDTLTFRGNFILADIRFPIEDVKVRYRNKDTLLSNIAPNDCMAGIRLGQRWQTPIVDPTQLMMGAFANSKAKELTNGSFNAEDVLKTKISEVRVLDELRELDWNGQRVPCYVAQSNEKGSKMQIWVNAANYRVLKQSYESDRHQLELLREPKKEE
ncbi:MAG TPA: hypothetical protein PLN21_20800 [Gemmatales bacterium]|nr:hypothetical protein [Gemmatales bacterium]